MQKFITLVGLTSPEPETSLYVPVKEAIKTEFKYEYKPIANSWDIPVVKRYNFTNSYNRPEYD